MPAELAHAELALRTPKHPELAHAELALRSLMHAELALRVLMLAVLFCLPGGESDVLKRVRICDDELASLGFGEAGAMYASLEPLRLDPSCVGPMRKQVQPTTSAAFT